MAKILIHLTHGPEHPTRAALAFLVGRAALEEGHTVTLFLAGDAVQLIRDAVLDTLVGLGTGKLRESYDAIIAGGARIYLSGMSSKARSVGESDLKGKSTEMATPNILVRLALEHDRMFNVLALLHAGAATPMRFIRVTSNTSLAGGAVRTA